MTGQSCKISCLTYLTACGMSVLLAAVARAEALRLQLPGIKQTLGCWNQPRVKTLPLSHSVWQNLASSIGAAADVCWNRPHARREGLQQMIVGIGHCN